MFRLRALPSTVLVLTMLACGSPTNEPVLRAKQASAATTGHQTRVRWGRAASAQLTTERLARGSETLSLGDEPAQRRERGAVHTRLGPGVVETLRRGEGALEQLWTWDARPAGNGDLTVRVSVGGARFVGSRASGLYFEHDEAEKMLRYGHGTWIDADGSRTRVAAAYVDDGIELRVPGDVVDASRFPAVLDPVIGSARAIETPVLRPSNRTTDRIYDPELHFDGTSFVAMGREGEVEIGRRFATDGSFVDATTFSLPGSYDEISCGGTTCVGVSLDPSFQYQRFATDGTAIDASPVTLPLMAPAFVRAAPLPTGGFILAWSLSDASFRYVRVDASGALVDAAPVLVTLPVTSTILNDVACATTTCAFGLSINEGAGWRRAVVRVALDGTVIDPSGIRTSDPFGNPSLVAAGTQYLVLGTPNAFWLPESGAAGGELFLSGAQETADCSAVACFVPTTSDELIRLAIGGGASSITGEPALDFRNRVACSDTDCAVLVGTAGGAHTAHRFDADTGLAVGSAFTVFNRANDQELGVCASDDAGNRLLVWYDDRAGEPRLRAQRFDGTGASLEPESRELSADEWTLHDLAYGGGVYLLALRSRSASGVYTMRLDSTGAPLDPAPSSLALSGDDPAVAFDGTQFLIVYDQSGEVRARRMTVAGALLEPTWFVVSDSGGGTQADVGFDGNAFLVAYATSRAGRGLEIYGVRVGSDGTVLDDPAFPIGSATDNQSQPEVVATPGDSFVFWQDARFLGTTGAAVFAARVQSDGTPLDPLGIRIAGTNLMGARWSGSALTVAMLDYEVFSGPMPDLRHFDVVSLDASGAQTEPVQRVYTTERNIRTRLCRGSGAGASLLFDDRFDDHGGTRANRIHVTVLGEQPLGASCTDASECGSGFCASGVCCDSACSGGCATCAASEGAMADGTCSPASSGAICRPTTGAMCDVEELCDGASLDCPDDVPDPMCAGDAGATGSDGGVSAGDAAAPGDGGRADGGASTDGGGCFVHPIAGSSAPGWVALLLALVVRRRRRA